MPSWTETRPPSWAPFAVATTKGWEDPVTGEVLVAIGNLVDRNVAGINEIYVGTISSTFADIGISSINPILYKLGDTITFKVKFSEPVTVVETPRLTVKFKNQTRVINYSAGSTTSVLSFEYVVATGDDCAVGELSITSLTLNGGTIKDSTGASNATLTFESTGAHSAVDYLANVLVDATPGTFGTVTIANSAGAGVKSAITDDILTVTVAVSERVVVVGLPTIVLTFDSGAKDAVYDPLTSTETSLVFKYTVVSGDTAGLTEFTVDSPVVLGEGITIKDMANIDLDPLTFTPPTITDWDVNTGPTLGTATLATASHGTRPITDDVLTLTVATSEAVTVTGNPTVSLDINGMVKSLVYTSTGSTTTSKKFVYTVVSGDSATTTQVHIDTPMLLAGGTMKDSRGQNVTLTLTPPSLTAWDVNVRSTFGANSLSTVAHGIRPITDDVITFTLAASEAITVTGNPTVVLTLNGSAKALTYNSGSGTTSLLFTYTVVGGDAATTGQVTIGSTVVLSGGTMKDAAGRSVSPITFTPPVVTGWDVNVRSTFGTNSITTVAHGTRPITDDVITFTLATSEVATVTGNPTVVLTINATPRDLIYVSGSGTSSLTFAYTVVGGDAATAGQVTIGSTVVLGTGTIKDAAGRSVSPITFTPPAVTAWDVNVRSTFGANSLASSAHGTRPITDDILTLTMATSEAITVTGNPTVVLTLNGSAKALTYASGSGTSSLLFTYTVVGGDAATTGQVTIGNTVVLGAGTMLDAAGRSVSPLTFTPPVVTGWDVNVRSTLGANSLASSAHGTRPITGDILTLTMATSEIVTVTGSPVVSLDINTTVRSLVYASGSGSTSLLFTYTVAGGDAAAAGQVHLDSPLVLSGGTIKDAAGRSVDPLTFTPDVLTAWDVNVRATLGANSLASSAHGTHPVTSDVLTLTMATSEAVTVTGNPVVSIDFNSGVKSLVYTSEGSTSTSKKFVYTVVEGDVATAGQIHLDSPLVLSGGTMVDARSLDVTPLTFTSDDLSAWAAN